MCDLGERTKSHLLNLLGLRDNWKTPLLINLAYPQANFPDAPAARFEMSQLGYGLKLQLNVLVTREINGREVQAELLRGILVEMIYRDRSNIRPGSYYVTPPDWLVEGVLALQAGDGAKGDVDLLRAEMARQEISSVDEVVRRKSAPLDFVSRRIFRAYARALVRLLLDSPGGHFNLARFIEQLPDGPQDGLSALALYFPATLGKARAKWWALTIAQLATSDRYTTLSAAETASRLDRILQLSFSLNDGHEWTCSLGNYSGFYRLPAFRKALQKALQELLLLTTQAHPFYRPIVQEEREVVDLLARGKTRDVPQRLRRIASARRLIESRASEIDDYLNWYEATQNETMSGTFASLIKPVQAQKEKLARRRDPISVYLDSVEMETD